MWDQSFSGRVGAGYNDNLLLSRDAREKSSFVFGGLDYTLFRLPLDGKQFTLFLSGDYTRYPEGQQVDHEFFGLALARFKFDLTPSWHPGFDLQYFYQDQVIDASITETNSGPTLVQGHNISARPSVRRDLPGGFWLEGSAAITRQYYRAPLDDYWEGGPQLSVGRDYGFQSSASLTYHWLLRDYDTREDVTLKGAGVPGTSLQFRQHEIEASLRHNFDAERHWRSVTKLGVLWSEDNGSGYFNYTRCQISEQLRYVAKSWEIKAQVRFANYDFLQQSASATDSSTRQKEVFAASLRGEKKLFPKLKVFAEYAFERSLSNRTLDEYQVNKVSGGIDWEF